MDISESNVGTKLNKDIFLEFYEEYKGYKMFGIFNDMGFRCGYVEIPKEHKLYKAEYEDLDIECHGGLTFSGNYMNDKYVVGFDCGHYGDGMDYKHSSEVFGVSDLSSIFNRFDSEDSMRSTEYVKMYCEKIIEQLIELEVE